MAIICNRKQLVDKIGKAQKAINSKSVRQSLKCLLLEASNGELNITGYDMETSVESIMSVENDIDYNFIVDSKLFGDIINKLGDDIVTLDVNTIEGVEKLRIISGSSDFTIALGDFSDYPILPKICEVHEFTINSKIFKDIITKTLIALSSDPSRVVLTGGLLEVDSNSVSMASLDGYRLSLAKENIETELNSKESIIIPGKSLNSINALIGSKDVDLKIAFGNKYMSVYFEDTIFTTNLIEGQFIDYEKLMPKKYNLETVVNRKELLSTIERATILSINEKNNLVKLSIGSESIQLTSKSDVGNSVEHVNIIERTGEVLDIAFNSKYLIDALKVIDADEVKLRFDSSVTPCTIHPLDNDNFVYLLLPVKVSSK